jgi:hypothetical protein
MNPDPKERRDWQLNLCFDAFHRTLTLLRHHIEELDDSQALELVDEIEFRTLAPIRKLRLLLDIPYPEETNDGRHSVDG